MDETFKLEPKYHRNVNHRVVTVVNDTDKALEFEFYKGQLTIRGVRT